MNPLDGIRIIDLSRYAPGPFATLICAALGAEVIKLEPPEAGDPLRALDGRAFERLNRGKKSVMLDLKSDAGRTRFFELARSADVLVEGFRPGAMERLGLDETALRERGSSLLYVSITGYEREGPYRNRAGHDINYMAFTGALEGASMPLPLQVADFAAGGLYAAMGILAGVMERGRTDAGRRLDLSMERGLKSMMLLADGPIGARLSGCYPNYSLYATSDDGTLSVGALEPKFWHEFCRGIERLDLVERMDDPDARSDVAQTVREHDLDHWAAIFSNRDACVEAVRAPRTSSASTLPFDLEEDALAPAPELGQHTREFFELD